MAATRRRGRLGRRSGPARSSRNEPTSGPASSLDAAAARRLTPSIETRVEARRRRGSRGFQWSGRSDSGLEARNPGVRLPSTDDSIDAFDHGPGPVAVRASHRSPGPSAGLRRRTTGRHSRTCSIDTGPTRNGRPAHRPATTVTPSRCWIAPRPERSTRQRCVRASPPRRRPGFAIGWVAPPSRPPASIASASGASRERDLGPRAPGRIVRA